MWIVITHVCRGMRVEIIEMTIVVIVTIAWWMMGVRRKTTRRITRTRRGIFATAISIHAGTLRSEWRRWSSVIPAIIIVIVIGIIVGVSIEVIIYRMMTSLSIVTPISKVVITTSTTTTIIV
jgi:hypothetical protein